MVAVHLGSGGDEHALSEAVAVLEHDLGALEVRDERVHGLLDDESNAHGSREVVDDVALVDELVDDSPIEDGVDDEVEVGVRAEVLDVGEPSRREIVEGPDFGTLLEQELAEMRADKTRPAGDEDLLPLVTS